MLDSHRLRNNPLDRIGVRASAKVTEEKTREVGVHALVAADKLIGEGQARHEATLLEPEDGCERAREEDAFDGGERDETLGKGRTLVADPVERPVCLLLDGGDRLDSIEEVLALCRLLDVRVNEKRVGFRVDVFPAFIYRSKSDVRGCSIGQ